MTDSISNSKMGEDEDILKYLLCDSESEFSSPERSPTLTDETSSTDNSPWRGMPDDVFSSLPPTLPDISIDLYLFTFLSLFAILFLIGVPNN